MASVARPSVVLANSFEARSGKPLWVFFVLLVFHQTVVAGAFPFAKIGLNQFNPFVYAFYRFCISSLIYIPILLRLRKNGSIEKMDNLKIFFIGLLLIPLNQVVFLIGQSLTSAGHASLMFAATPVFVYLLAVPFLGEKLKIFRIVGILIAIAGVYIVVSGGGSQFGFDFLLGDLLVLVAVAAWAGATVLGKPLALKYGAFRVMGLALVYGSVVYFPYGLYRAINADYSGITITGWMSIAYMAVIISVFAYVLWYWVLKYLEASRVAIMQNIQPIIASLLAAFFLGEAITSIFIIGGVIIIGGVVLTEIK